jgi:hypothetical protein
MIAAMKANLMHGGNRRKVFKTSIEVLKDKPVETSIKEASALMDIGKASTEREF